ncbi:MAG TPA: MauE/DoxX family redox-associated membrane protein [Pyrinomonadaceae bacterium]|nr:MauE/DoxX family redox-associated membrane protein [Pyrinomonadaceae bacterium]
MSLFVVPFRLALSLVFAVAGVTKLLDLAGTREAVKNFGAPQPLIPTLSFLLPFIELAIALGLLVNSTTSAAALGALILLSLFIVAISINLAKGRTHDCHCFGQLHSRPLGWSTLLRNFLFALAAGVVLWQSLNGPVESISQTFRELGKIQWVLLIAGILGTIGTLVDYRRRARLTAKEAVAPDPKPEGLPINSIAPAFELTAYEGGSRSLAQLIAPGKPLLLIFTSPSCGPCVALFQEIKDWQRAHSDQLTIGLISRGTIKDNFVNVARNDLGEVLLQKEREVAQQYKALVTPTAVLVNRSGLIASPLAAGADEIRNLLHKVLEKSESIGGSISS